MRLRAGVLPGPSTGGRGQVLLLHGRTEFLEKYQPVAAAFVERGFAVASLDWRGQGGSARSLADVGRGHVTDFAEYQRDLAALRAAPQAQAPGPVVAVAHSMGGAIALRALVSGGFKPDAMIFSAPMWGLALKTSVELTARLLARAAVALGQGWRFVPGAGPEPYTREGYADNALTADPERFAWIAAMTEAAGPRALGGPTLGWLRAAFAEMDALARKPLPMPALILAGTAESVVSLEAIRARAAQAAATLVEIPGGRHELLYETPERRAQAWDAIDAHLAARGV